VPFDCVPLRTRWQRLGTGATEEGASRRADDQPEVPSRPGDVRIGDVQEDDPVTRAYDVR